MSLKTPEKVRKLQRALYVKAKEEPDYRFYLLYDKIYRGDILEFAYRKCKAHGGAPGVDGESFARSRDKGYGRERWLRELAEEQRGKRYRARPVRRQWIEKSGGGKRPLGIAIIRDRVVQMAAVLVVGPIFEADLDPDQGAVDSNFISSTKYPLYYQLLTDPHEGTLPLYFDFD